MTISSSETSSTSTPSVRTASTVDCVSPERPKPRTCVSPSQIAPISTARCEIDLSPGTAMCPTSAVAGATLVTAPSQIRVGAWHRSGLRPLQAQCASRDSYVRVATRCLAPTGGSLGHVHDRRDDDLVALRLQDARCARGFGLAADEERERAAALAGHVLQLEVF